MNSVYIYSLSLQWVNSVLHTCTPEFKVEHALAAPLDALRSALGELVTAYAAPIQPLVPRPALVLLSYIACAAYLLEHAIWAYKVNAASRRVDLDVFRRWVVEGGLNEAIVDVRRAKQAQPGRLREDKALVYGVDVEDKVSSRL